MENGKCECALGRIKKRGADELRSLTNRLKRIEGQVRGVGRMLESDTYCVDILMQVSAISSALNAFSRELLANHIRSCVSEDIKKGKTDGTEELIKVLSAFIK